MYTRCAALIFLLTLVVHERTTLAVSFQKTSTLCPPVFDYSSQNTEGILVTVSDAEFFVAYSKVFKMSDGSKVDPLTSTIGAQTIGSNISFNYTHTLMRMVGVDRIDQQPGNSTFLLCGNDFGRLALFAVLGNFASSTVGDPNQATMGGSVVVDPFTGMLVRAGDYKSVRSYFVEALLVISILVIARISMVRSVTVVQRKLGKVH